MPAMGYFRRPVDRERSRAAKESLREKLSPDLPWQHVSEKPLPGGSWVRFSALSVNAFSGRRDGIFMAVDRVEKDPGTEPHALEGVQTATAWFNENLRVPNIDDEKAIWFFKTRATVCMARAWELCHWLREAAVVVEMQVLPEGGGRVVYEDEHQVAVVPYRDARVR